MNILLIAGLFLTLISPVAPIRCLQCFGPPQNCTNSNAVEIDCGENEDSCVDLYMRFKFLGSHSAYVLKSCGQSKYCVPGYYSASALNGAHLESNLECCQSDLCNSRESSLVPPSSNFIPNGFQCPACFTFSSDECNPTDTVACMDLETHCSYLAASVKFASVVEDLVDTVFDMAAQGCGTADFCAFQPGSLEMEAGLVFINITHAGCHFARTNIPETTRGTEEAPQSKTFN